MSAATTNKSCQLELLSYSGRVILLGANYKFAQYINCAAQFVNS